MDLLNLYGHFSLLTIAASLLAILALRIMTGSTSQQVKLVREFDAQDNVVPLFKPSTRSDSMSRSQTV